MKMQNVKTNLAAVIQFFSDMKARLAELLKWKIMPSERFLFVILIGPPLI